MKFGILCAMDEEIKTLIDNLDNKKEVNIKGIIFYEGTIFNQSVVLVKSGIGKVEAGLSTALLISSMQMLLLILVLQVESVMVYQWVMWLCQLRQHIMMLMPEQLVMNMDNFLVNLPDSKHLKNGLNK
jgi:hypothetical protein